MLRGETSISIKTLHQTRKQRAPVSFRVGRHRFLLERNVRCIFCKQDSSASRSAEHVMPESIGSKKRVLAPGVVCDQCNNYFARKVEDPILNHPSMRNFRAWYQVPNKRGKYPSLQGHIAGTDISVGLRRGRGGPIRSGASFQRKRLCGIRIPMNGSKRVLDAAGS
jgi:HNH endonuclease